MSKVVFVKELEGAEIDESFVSIIVKLNRLGYITNWCCSGVGCDHDGKCEEGYISFPLANVNEEQHPNLIADLETVVSKIHGLSIDRQFMSMEKPELNKIIVRTFFACDGTSWAEMCEKAEAEIGSCPERGDWQKWREDRFETAKKMTKEEHGDIFVDTIDDEEHLSLWRRFVNLLILQQRTRDDSIIA